MSPDDVLTFCFERVAPENAESHMAFWVWMMRGGADDGIIARFTPLVARAARGDLDDWAETPRGRLALILVTDQFPRSVHRGTAAAYALDPKALQLAEQGLACGHFAALAAPWERTLFALPLVHAEGPRHRDRAALNVALAEETLALAPDALKPVYRFCLAQSHRHQAVIDRFGRHPHRNAVLGRASTPAERAYLAEGVFPHEQDISLSPTR